MICNNTVPIYKINFFQILLSGSAAVEAAVCPDNPLLWRDGDIDIFATCEGAPHVRARLVHYRHLVCTGVSERYKYTEENNLIYFQHAENYCPRHVFARYDGGDGHSFPEATYQRLKRKGDQQLLNEGHSLALRSS